jgi:hypothetical protein
MSLGTGQWLSGGGVGVAELASWAESSGSGNYYSPRDSSMTIDFNSGSPTKKYVRYLT